MLTLNGVTRISHFVGHCGVNHGEQLFLDSFLIIENLFGNVSDLDHLNISKDGLEFISFDLYKLCIHRLRL